ncbi:hypothetical protein L5515_014917 [Caenorhabditis briggsae]|uniref:Uncharacterized protein n=1 Tax=Caenorhabditis briggsae TaxID=6238 RepID=A0AAE9EEK9_CAEBR|nr:hypothetical protein L5515_014917 [Caenorhabditis briggsae]
MFCARRKKKWSDNEKKTEPSVEKKIVLDEAVKPPKAEIPEISKKSEFDVDENGFVIDESDDEDLDTLKYLESQEPTQVRPYTVDEVSEIEKTYMKIHASKSRMMLAIYEHRYAKYPKGLKVVEEAKQRIEKERKKREEEEEEIRKKKKEADKMKKEKDKEEEDKNKKKEKKNKKSHDEEENYDSGIQNENCFIDAY